MDFLSYHTIFIPEYSVPNLPELFFDKMIYLKDLCCTKFEINSPSFSKLEDRKLYQRRLKIETCHVLYFCVMRLQAICVFLLHRLNITDFASLN